MQRTVGKSLDSLNVDKWSETFIAVGSESQPGLVMGDSGCFRCVGGRPSLHKMILYLKQYRLKPLAINRVEEFVFGPKPNVSCFLL